MQTVNLRALIAKLTPLCRLTLENAAGLSLTYTHHFIEIEHWLIKLLNEADAVSNLLLEQCAIDKESLLKDLAARLALLKTGHIEAPALSLSLCSLLRNAWLLSSLEFQDTTVNSGHILCALVDEQSLNLAGGQLSAELAKLSSESLRQALPNAMAHSGEVRTANPETFDKTSDRQSALAQFTIDLTAQAKNHKLDPVFGRDAEIRQVIDILMRRRQNNPILTGEAGVGKTAVVEGLALRIAANTVPPSLSNVALHVLDLSLLQAGAGVKGEFENRLKRVIEEVRSANHPIILFIDEAHTLIGAGGQAGQGDAANLLKPVLARGELRTIAATTWAEYKKYIERDAALARRFQVVKIDEPSETTAIHMLRGLSKTLERHHNVKILDEALQEAVRLSKRYITVRQLPDKAISLLDTACARVAIGHQSVPALVEQYQKQLEQLATAIERLTHEQTTLGRQTEVLAELRSQQAITTQNLTMATERWQQELALIHKIQALHKQLDLASVEDSQPSDLQPLRQQLQALIAQLGYLQGEHSLLQAYVDKQVIATVVADWTGIPVGRMLLDEMQTILDLRQHLAKRIVGQEEGITLIAQSVMTARAKLADPRKPLGVFLLVGTSGVGKTETALALAELLYGGVQNLITINMSEFKEEHKVATLIGSPPGYVGYGEGGVLTEAIRRRPHCILLLDEIEKAHPGVQDLFYQVFDKGVLRDSEGRDIDFKNVLIMMTANTGTDIIHRLVQENDKLLDVKPLNEVLRPALLKAFKPAFLSRLQVVPYWPLKDEQIQQIIKSQLERVQQRVVDTYKVKLSYQTSLVDYIAERCKEVESGARNIEHIITSQLLPELAMLFLSHSANTIQQTKPAIREVCVAVSEHKIICNIIGA
ncbi:MAG: hypothetical protein K0S11_1382 [Gammaproteobacteria bacterium]|nr:hypothetical protein [Gammaproteobacteria bacterium]